MHVRCCRRAWRAIGAACFERVAENGRLRAAKEQRHGVAQLSVLLRLRTIRARSRVSASWRERALWQYRCHAAYAALRILSAHAGVQRDRNRRAIQVRSQTWAKQLRSAYIHWVSHWRARQQAEKESVRLASAVTLQRLARACAAKRMLQGHQQESIFESPAQLPRSRPLTPPTFLPPLVAARLRAQSPADSSASASAASADLHGPTLDGRHTEVTEETGGDTETAGNAEPEAARAAKKDDDLASATSFFMFSSAALYAESAPHASNMDR
jgi:hypothetical protein